MVAGLQPFYMLKLFAVGADKSSSIIDRETEWEDAQSKAFGAGGACCSGHAGNKRDAGFGRVDQPSLSGGGLVVV
jgi:hypothetical protein